MARGTAAIAGTRHRATLTPTDRSPGSRLRGCYRLRRRSTASRISGMRSLPKYMSSPPTNMVGEPKPPRSISSCVLARSRSLIGCCSMPARNFSAIDADLGADLGQHRHLRDVLVVAPIGLERRQRERHQLALGLQQDAAAHRLHAVHREDGGPVVHADAQIARPVLLVLLAVGRLRRHRLLARVVHAGIYRVEHAADQDRPPGDVDADFLLHRSRLWKAK